MSLNFLYDLRLLRYEFFKKARFFENWKNFQKNQKIFFAFLDELDNSKHFEPYFFFEIFLWKNTLQHLKKISNTLQTPSTWRVFGFLHFSTWKSHFLMVTHLYFFVLNFMADIYALIQNTKILTGSGSKKRSKNSKK